MAEAGDGPVQVLPPASTADTALSGAEHTAAESQSSERHGPDTDSHSYEGPASPVSVRMVALSRCTPRPLITPASAEGCSEPGLYSSVF